MNQFFINHDGLFILHIRYPYPGPYQVFIYTLPGIPWCLESMLMRSESTLAMYPGTRYQQKQNEPSWNNCIAGRLRLIPVPVHQSHIYFIYSVYNLYIYCQYISLVVFACFDSTESSHYAKNIKLWISLHTSRLPAITIAHALSNDMIEHIQKRDNELLLSRKKTAIAIVILITQDIL